MKQAHTRAYGPYKVAHDGCEWNPEQHRGSEITDRHFSTTAATTVVGNASFDGTIRYRLCGSCAALPLFRRRPRQRIRRVETKAR